MKFEAKCVGDDSRKLHLLVARYGILHVFAAVFENASETRLKLTASRAFRAAFAALTSGRAYRAASIS